MYFYGDESEIDLEKYGEREFSEWRWMPLEELPLEVLHLPLCQACSNSQAFMSTTHIQQLTLLCCDNIAGGGLQAAGLQEGGRAVWAHH